MSRVAVRAGFDGATQLDLSRASEMGSVWSLTAKHCAVTQDQIAQAVAETFRTEVADLAMAEKTATKLIPASVAEKFSVFPLRDRDRHLVLATADPTNFTAEQEIGFTSGRTPVMHVAPPGVILSLIQQTYSPEKAAETLLSNVDVEMDSMLEVVEDDEPAQITEEESSAGPVVRLTNMVVQEAIQRGSSDIHIQPTPTGGIVRFRVDGVLRTGMQMPLPVMTRVVSRIKIMGRMDITDRLRPQDGRARVQVDGKKYDLRISTVPTRLAEKAVIRILDPHQSGTLEESGIHAAELKRVRRVLSNRDGVFVVTGPTGSGKTTTLYGALREIATEDVNIMTVEDPVEYELPGLTQIQVETKQGVTFASALRAILRQDPDVIFVGEIRDGETAAIAAQASLTGHLVLATLHTNDAIGTIRRFEDLGLDLGTVTETLRGALAQRLVRRLCRHCAVPVTEPLTDEEQIGVERYGVPPVARAPGCDLCSGSGYLGRLPVHEFLTVTPDLVRLILAHAPPSDMLAQARSDGMVTMLEAALTRVAAGETTLEEVGRVIGDSDQDPRSEAEEAVEPERDAARSAPRPASSQPKAPPQEESHRTSPPDLEDPEDLAPHILVVDDDGANRTIARGLLEKQGYTVTEATDGSEALVHLARGEHFSLMVLDLDMPMLGGREVLRAVRGSMATAGLPVVVLTGTRDLDTEIQLMEEGADDYIRKPIDPPRFLIRVKAALRRAGA